MKKRILIIFIIIFSLSIFTSISFSDGLFEGKGGIGERGNSVSSIGGTVINKYPVNIENFINPIAWILGIF